VGGDVGGINYECGETGGKGPNEKWGRMVVGGGGGNIEREREISG